MGSFFLSATKSCTLFSDCCSSLPDLLSLAGDLEGGGADGEPCAGARLALLDRAVQPGDGRGDGAHVPGEIKSARVRVCTQ